MNNLMPIMIENVTEMTRECLQRYVCKIHELKIRMAEMASVQCWRYES